MERSESDVAKFCQGFTVQSVSCGDIHYLEHLLDRFSKVSLSDAVQVMHGTKFWHGARSTEMTFDFAKIQGEVEEAMQWAQSVPEFLREKVRGIEPVFLAAIRLWTGTSVCYAVTGLIRNPHRNIDSVGPALPFLKLLYCGLHMLPAEFLYEGELFRVEQGKRSNFFEVMKPGFRFGFYGPTSFSSSKRSLLDFLPSEEDKPYTLYFVERGVGYKIAEFSVHPSENEVLLEGVSMMEVMKARHFDQTIQEVNEGLVDNNLFFVNCRMVPGFEMLSHSPARKRELIILEQSADEGNSILGCRLASVAGDEAEREHFLRPRLAKAGTLELLAGQPLHAQSSFQDTCGESEPRCRTLPLKQSMGFHKNGVNSVTFNFDGSLLASSSWDDTVVVQGLGEDFNIKIIAHTDNVTCVKFNPTRNLLASASYDQSVLLWQIEDRNAKCVGILMHEDKVNCVEWRCDGQLLASGSDCKVKLWKFVHNGLECIGTLIHNDSICSMAFSPDGSVLATSADDCSLSLWFGKTYMQQICTKLEGRRAAVKCMSFSATEDGVLLATGSLDGTVRMWNLEKLLMAPATHGNTDANLNDLGVVLTKCERAVNAIAFSGRGGWLAAGYDDGFVRVWGGESKQLQTCVAKVKHMKAVHGLGLNRDGLLLASASWDRTVKLWEIGSEAGPLCPAE